MHDKFARTSNVRAFYAAYSRLQERGAEEASWMFVIGLPGFGKTRCMKHVSIETSGIYVRAKTNWSASWMQQELAGELSLDTEGSIKSLFGRLLGALVDLDAPIVVDEARNMLHDAKLLETLRDLSDTSGATVILSGEEFVLVRLTNRYPQIRSRISEVVTFRPASLEDVRVTCDTLCEAKVADDLVAEIHSQSRGYYREIKNAIAAVERRAKRDKLQSIELAHVAGLRLCQDRSDARNKTSPAEV